MKNKIFTAYIIILLIILTIPCKTYGNANIIPFKEITRYHITSKLFLKNVIGNIVLFIPLGIFLYKKRKIIYIIPLVIEISQIFIGRVFDIDDVILNIIGILFGISIEKKGKL